MDINQAPQSAISTIQGTPAYVRRSVGLILGVVGLAGIFLGIGWYLTPRGLAPVDSAIRTLSIDGVTWDISEIVATPEARARGLSFRKNLPAQTGLLFLFEVPDRYGFWMKDMQFPIDIIFLSGGVVDSVVRDRQPGDLQPVFPVGSIDRVLEVNAGEAASVKPGDVVEMNRPGANETSWLY